MRRQLTAAAIAVATLLSGEMPVSADPPERQPVVNLSCEELGDFTARITNVNASLVKGATLVTGKSDLFGTGVVFDVYDMYDNGRGHAPVVADRGFAKDLVHCTVDLSEVVGIPGYVVPIGIKLTGHAAKNL